MEIMNKIKSVFKKEEETETEKALLEIIRKLSIELESKRKEIEDLKISKLPDYDNEDDDINGF